MKQFYNALNTVCNKIGIALHSETTGGRGSTEEDDPIRGPPPNRGRADAATADLKGNLAPC